MKYLISIFLLLGAEFIIDVLGADSGPVGPISIYEIKKCDPDVNLIDFQAQLVATDDGSNSVSASFNIPDDYGEEVQFSIIADKWENNAWQKNVFTFNPTSLVQFMNENLEKTWTMLREALQPNVEDPLKLPKGEYKLEKHQEDWHDVELSETLYGRFLATINLSVNGDDIACAQIEIETFEP